MTLRSTMRWAVIATIACATVACGGETKRVPGPDSNSDSDASVVPYSDGKSAIAISCKRASGCQQRAQAMCGGPYTTLKTGEGGVAMTIRCN